MLYVGDIIQKTNPIVIPDSEETLTLAEESRSKMLLKHKDNMMQEKIKQIDTTPIDYAALNKLYKDFETRPTNVEVPKELPKVSMVNTSLKKLKYHLANFDVVVKERTTPTTITKGTWGFEHTKACFRDEIIPFVKALKDLFNTFDQYLIDELSEVQNVFHQMEQAVEQHRLESKTFEVKMNQVLNENERLLEQVINKDIVNIIMNSSVDNASVNVHECEKCLKLETELLNKKDFVEKEIYDKLFKSFTTLEKHCISLEVDTQLNQEIFQRDNSVSNQSAPSFDQYFEFNELKAQSQEKDMVIKKLKERIKSLSGKMNEDKIKKDLKEIETINIELDHRVSKLIAENEHLKQTYKQLYDSIKPTRIRSKEQCDDLINQVNLKSVEISDLNASLQEKVLVITALKDDLRKLKGKALVDDAVTKHTIDPETLKIDVEPITPKLLNKKTAHSAYIKHTQEEAAVLRDLVEHVKSNYPLDHSLEYACMYTQLIQELLTNISKTCPSINNSGEKLVAVTPKNKEKRHSKLNANSELLCVKCNGCMLSDNHDLCVLDFINNVNARVKSKFVKKSSKRKVWKPTGKVFTYIGYIWRPTGRTFTIVGNACPLTRITTTAKVPLKKPTALESDTPKPVVTLVYSKKPRKPKTNVPVSKSKVLKSISANKKEPSKSWGSIVSNVPSSSLKESRSSKLFSGITISRVYYIEGLGHNLFFVGQFCDSNLKVAFRQHTCFIRNLEGVDLLTGSRGNNLYTLSLGDMMASSPICLLSKALKTIRRIHEMHPAISKGMQLEFCNQDVHEIKYKDDKSKKKGCMAYFRSLHSHLQVLSKDDLKGTHVEHGFKREFMSIFGQDVDTFTSTMFLNVDQLQKQLDKDEFQEDGSMAAFWVMTVVKETRHQRQYERRVNKRQMQTQESKIDTGKALDADLVDTESIRDRIKQCKMIAEDNNILSNLKSLLKVGLTKQTTSLLANNAELKAQIQEKVFAIAALKNDLRKVKGNSVDTKFDKPSFLGKPVLPSLRNQSVVRQPNAFKSAKAQMSKQRSDLGGKPTGRIFNTVSLRWVPTRKLFDSCTSKVDSEPTHGTNVDILTIHECKQTLDLSAGKSQSMVAEKDDISETIVKVDSQMMITEDGVKITAVLTYGLNVNGRLITTDQAFELMSNDVLN
ncbi:hypothetical protein Tco_1507507 [Tanacetum coccineum]